MLTITTYDWVPEFPRGFVRDLRIRWACEEAGLPYRIATVPLSPKSPDHLAHQPFGQVPYVTIDGRTMFESGAILLHLGTRSDALMPADADGRAEVLEWAVAALNSVEPVVSMWSLARNFDKNPQAEATALKRLTGRLARLDPVLAARDFIAAGRFTLADILMTDALRLIGADGALTDFPALSGYVDRLTARPAFRKAHQDQMDHFAAATPPEGV